MVWLGRQRAQRFPVGWLLFLAVFYHTSTFLNIFKQQRNQFRRKNLTSSIFSGQNCMTYMEYRDVIFQNVRAPHFKLLLPRAQHFEVFPSQPFSTPFHFPNFSGVHHFLTNIFSTATTSGTTPTARTMSHTISASRWRYLHFYSIYLEACFS